MKWPVKPDFWSLLFFTILSLAGCATAPEEQREPEVVGNGEEMDYRGEYRHIVEAIRERALRPVSFDREGSKAAVEYLLHALDSRYLVLHQDDVERLKEKFALRDLASDGYRRLDEVIDEFSRLENMMLEDEILAVLAESVEKETAAAVADKDYSNWAATEPERRERLAGVIAGDIGYYTQQGFGRDETISYLTSYYSRVFGGTERLTAKERFGLVANAVTELVDSNSSYYLNLDFALDPSSFSMMGIGAVLSEKIGTIKVEKLVEDGPADKAGMILAGDLITAISQDGQDYIDTNALGLDETTKLLRGPSGTTVYLWLRRDGEVVNAAIVRGHVRLREPRVSSEIRTLPVDGRTVRVGVVSVPSFYVDFMAMRQRDPNYRSSARDVKDALVRMEQAGVDGVVLDLRDNGGGSLQEGDRMAGLFIEAGSVLQIQRGRGGPIYKSTRREFDYVFKKPLVVLVNESSAGSSEIVAGAVQDYGVGLVVGRTTFGLGVVQSVEPTPNGRITITESEFFRVTGAAYQLNGVSPDITLESPGSGTREATGERYKRNVISPGSIPATAYTKYDRVTEALIDALKRESSQRIGARNGDSQQVSTADVSDQELWEALRIAVRFIRAGETR